MKTYSNEDTQMMQTFTNQVELLLAQHETDSKDDEQNTTFDLNVDSILQTYCQWDVYKFIYFLIP